MPTADRTNHVDYYVDVHDLSRILAIMERS